MKFLKENLFLTITVVVVVVGVSIAAVLKHSEDNQADKYAEKCAKLGGDMSSIAAGGINKDRKDAAEQYIRRMDIEAESVKNDFLRRSRSGYQVMNFEVGEKVVPAFPVELFKDRERLLLLVPGQYSQQVALLLKSLKPTVPPSEEEVALETETIRAQETPTEKTEGIDGPASTSGIRTPAIIRRSEGERRPSEFRGIRPSEIRPDERRTFPAGFTPSGEAYRRSASRLGTGRDSSLPGKPTPEEKAINNISLQKSRQGWIYADRSSMFDTDISGTAHFNDKKLWFRQVSLWLQQDIVDAINLTNSQVRSKSTEKSGQEEGVSASAVKRLVDIKVRGYVLGQGASGAGAGRGEGAYRQPAAQATAVSLQYLSISNVALPKTVPLLTKHYCNKLYDVVHYDFTVVLPMRHLGRLLKNVRTRNFHTILLISVGPSSGGAERTGQETRTLQKQDSWYYYGPDPVKRVQITAQLLMLAEWTRGRWDPKANKWDENYPALMPADFLSEINKIDPGALRSEDTKRLPASAAPAAGSAYGHGAGSRRGGS